MILLLQSCMNLSQGRIASRKVSIPSGQRPRASHFLNQKGRGKFFRMPSVGIPGEMGMLPQNGIHDIVVFAKEPGPPRGRRVVQKIRTPPAGTQHKVFRHGLAAPFQTSLQDRVDVTLQEGVIFVGFSTLIGVGNVDPNLVGGGQCWKRRCRGGFGGTQTILAEL